MQTSSNKTHTVPLFNHCFVQGHGWGGPRPASDQNSGDKEEYTERRLRWRKDGEKQILPCSYSLLKRALEERKVCTRLSEKKQWEPEMSQGVMELTLPIDSWFSLLFHIVSKEPLNSLVGGQAGWYHPHFVDQYPETQRAWWFAQSHLICNWEIQN